MDTKTQGQGRRVGRRRRFPPFLAVPIALGLCFWLLAWAIEQGQVYGLL